MYAAAAFVVGAGINYLAADASADAATSAAGMQSDASIVVAQMYADASMAQAQAAVAAGVIGADAMLEAARIESEAATAASEAQLVFQEKGLNYLIESEKLPMQYRDQALGVLGDLFGVTPGQDASASTFFGSPLAQRLEINQDELVTKAQQSPMYAAMMGTRKAGEESILRNASATGGLRSGNVQENLYDYNVQLGKESLMSAYGLSYGEELADQANTLNMITGLSGLTGYQGQAPNVAGMYSNMGQTAGQGIWNAGQATAGGVSGAGQYQANSMNSAANYIAQGANAQGQGIMNSANALAGGQIGAANAWQQGYQNIGNMGMMGIGAYLQQGQI